MKKIVLFGLLVIGFAMTGYSQRISDHALGLRFGDNDGFGTEISYQTRILSSNRLEFDLGWRDDSGLNSFFLTGLYQWVFNIDGGFNWYVGAGGGLLFVDGAGDNDIIPYVAGDIGIEYNFPGVPVLVSLDFRPVLPFTEGDNDLSFDVGLGIRYQF